MKAIDQYLEQIEREIKNSKLTYKTDEVGIVQEIRDGVALAQGLDKAGYGVKGYIIDMLEDSVGIIVLGDYLTIKSGEQVRALKYTLSIPVSEKMIGRTVDPLGQPIDGGEAIPSDAWNPVEKVAPSVVYRKPVTVPMQTGIKSIDALFPIGRGQRELIIGDRGTGKSTIALDTIINQKGQSVVCIYWITQLL